MTTSEKTPAARTLNLTESQAYCRDLARSHYENFTVVSWLLPRELRQHLYNVYAYCRYVDDLGDEALGDRCALLDEWERELRQCYDGSPSHPIFRALRPTIGQFGIPLETFLKLIEANRMDQGSGRFATYRDVECYCRHSANPVGHLVLYVFGYRDEECFRLSDATCTALQLTNFWQDVARDWNMNRIYLPQEDMKRFGVTDAHLSNGQANGRFRELLQFEIERTRALFREGIQLVPKVKGRLRIDLALFNLGGWTVLNKIEQRDCDVLSQRPVLSRRDKRSLLWRGLYAWITGQVSLPPGPQP